MNSSGICGEITISVTSVMQMVATTFTSITISLRLILSFAELPVSISIHSVYADLADHFRKEHFLCEEGKCATEEFTGAFRNEIEYKAHVASVHGKSLNKQQVKQARTLQFEITLGPRGRRGQNEQNVSMRSR